MKNTANMKFNFKESGLWLAILALTTAAFFCTYYFNISGPIQAIVWIGWLISSTVLAYFTALGQQAFAFAKEANIELKKIVWPTRQETIQTTSIVMIMVTVTGFVLWGIDSAMMWIIAKITHLG